MNERRRKQMRNGAAFLALIIISSATGILVVLNDEHSVELSLPGLRVEAPLAIFLGLAVLTGVLVTWLILWLRLRRLTRKLADLREENRALKVEVEQLRTAP
ncbi:MAG: DUF1049 domain-containing protein, partial [Thioalkalivibrio sp.]|nr:DUF1049 domain-containing protein [Thioalkalivibrio sp.]